MNGPIRQMHFCSKALLKTQNSGKLKSKPTALRDIWRAIYIEPFLFLICFIFQCGWQIDIIGVRFQVHFCLKTFSANIKLKKLNRKLILLFSRWISKSFFYRFWSLFIHLYINIYIHHIFQYIWRVDVYLIICHMYFCSKVFSDELPISCKLNRLATMLEQ